MFAVWHSQLSAEVKTKTNNLYQVLNCWFQFQTSNVKIQTIAYVSVCEYEVKADCWKFLSSLFTAWCNMYWYLKWLKWNKTVIYWSSASPLFWQNDAPLSCSSIQSLNKATLTKNEALPQYSLKLLGWGLPMPILRGDWGVLRFPRSKLVTPMTMCWSFCMYVNGPPLSPY